MQPKWKMIAACTGAALLGASALAVAADGGRGPSETEAAYRNTASADAEPCPPDACSIVFKTATGGPPSPVIDLR